MSARSFALALSWLAAWVLSGAAQAAAPVGQPAPELTGRDTRGNLVKLSGEANGCRMPCQLGLGPQLSGTFELGT